MVNNIVKIQLGSKASQKPPESKETDQELYDLYKKETGKPAIYKRGGEWHESKAYMEWRSNFHATQFAEIMEEEESDEMMEEAIDIAVKMTSDEVDLTNLKEENLELLGITSKEAMKKELEIDDEEYEDMEKAVAKNNGKKHMKGSELQAKISLYKKNMDMRCRFLYKLMNDKMEFIEEITDEELQYLKEIDEALKQ